MGRKFGIIRGTKYANAPAMLATSEGVSQEVSAPMHDKSIPNSITESIPSARMERGREASSPPRSTRSSKSGYIGVARHLDRWRAYISVDNKREWLGLFDCPIEAAIARDIALISTSSTRNFRCRLNFPDLINLFGSQVTRKVY